MPIETWFNEEERLRMMQTSDPEINEALNEINKVLGDKLFVSEREVIPRRGFFSSWFNSPKPFKVYSLYRHIQGMSCQEINFCQDHDWSINTSVRKSYILTYLYGIISGYRDAIRWTQEQVKSLKP